MHPARMLAAAVTAGACLAVPSIALGPPSVQMAAGVTLLDEVKHDTSAPLRELAARHVSRPTGRIVPELGRLPLPTGPYTHDPVVQPRATAATTAQIVQNYEGVGEGKHGYNVNAIPPDTVGAAGRTQYVQWVNTALVVLDKRTGEAVFGAEDGNVLWEDFGGECEQRNDGDPVVNYDRFADRWVLQQFAVTNGYYECVAVSTTPDATGSYHRYAFKYAAFNDYPKAGVGLDAYYVTYNMFEGETGSKVCAFERAAMLAGRKARQQCVQMADSITGLLPADLDGRIRPPAGSPEPIMGLTANGINVWNFRVDWARPSRTTMGEPEKIDVAAFKPACQIVADDPIRFQTCVPQPVTGVAGQVAVLGLDSLSDRLMYRLARRVFADGHEAIVVTHAVDALPYAAAALRWYELRKPRRGTWSVYQQGTYSPEDLISRWMGSAAMDRFGNIAIGYSASSATTTFPGIRFTGRTPRDPKGTLGAERVIVEGTGAQTTAALIARWGDYSAMSVDPVDDCTFWYTTEYMAQVGVFNWNTKVTSIRFPNCR